MINSRIHAALLRRIENHSYIISEMPIQLCEAWTSYFPPFPISRIQSTISLVPIETEGINHSKLMRINFTRSRSRQKERVSNRESDRVEWCVYGKTRSKIFATDYAEEDRDERNRVQNFLSTRKEYRSMWITNILSSSNFCKTSSNRRRIDRASFLLRNTYILPLARYHVGKKDASVQRESFVPKIVLVAD